MKNKSMEIRKPDIWKPDYYVYVFEDFEIRLHIPTFKIEWSGELTREEIDYTIDQLNLGLDLEGVGILLVDLFEIDG